jgi:TolA-binding protein
MFLRARALSLSGDAAAAAAAARAYLDRYPDGLRRPDAERLLGR